MLTNAEGMYQAYVHDMTYWVVETNLTMNVGRYYKANKDLYKETCFMYWRWWK